MIEEHRAVPWKVQAGCEEQFVSHEGGQTPEQESYRGEVPTGAQEMMLSVITFTFDLP